MVLIHHCHHQFNHKHNYSYLNQVLLMFLISSISLSFSSSMLCIQFADSWCYSNNGLLYKYNPYYLTTSTSLSLSSSSLSPSSSLFRLSSKGKETKSFSSSPSPSPLLTIAVTSSSRDLDDGCFIIKQYR
mmetsp:Transcript_46563/g.50220  ORF Transcript_46563/g.50220 Transcript_46563/m.50220 type:complete len:130 (-) Transcript_46563:45-434(-)